MTELSKSGQIRPNRSKQPRLDLHQWKLPRGRHGLARDLVERSQRERLLAAAVQATAANGYRDMAVADILALAGVGRETFYKHFKGKEDCFLQANDLLVNDLEAKAGEVYGGPGPWPERVRNTLELMLNWLAVDPGVPQVMLIEMATVGSVAVERFAATFGRFAARLDEDPTVPDHPPPLPSIARIAGGAVFARVYEEVALGKAADLPDLLPSLTFEFLLPYMGEEVAREEERKAAEQLELESSS